jgi:hypothetical protein
LILQAESESKYGSDYFDENTEEVVRGRRPDEIEPERQEDPFDDMPSEEDWPKQASIKLMVKIARKLDDKGFYGLADMLTQFFAPNQPNQISLNLLNLNLRRKA